MELKSGASKGSLLGAKNGLLAFMSACSVALEFESDDCVAEA
jgi:hypothetical protein